MAQRQECRHRAVEDEPVAEDSAVNKGLSKKPKPPTSGVPPDKRQHRKPWKPAQPDKLQPFKPAEPAKIVMQKPSVLT
ncbi:hypothetical protein [Bremerella cremea]|uniref:hypothetical protein n=1 Tax=Bremerella cremea TaxID=1031537 RepID=UPI0011C052AB|nr:hypothetical protein [Bremerella cremea]